MFRGTCKYEQEYFSLRCLSYRIFRNIQDALQCQVILLNELFADSLANIEFFLGHLPEVHPYKAYSIQATIGLINQGSRVQVSLGAKLFRSLYHCTIVTLMNSTILSPCTNEALYMYNRGTSRRVPIQSAISQGPLRELMHRQ